ncbi:rhomboid family intramembrane serine protease [Pontimicrobium sp. MEBiC06410]
MGNLNLITIVIIAANVFISIKGFNDFYFREQYKFNVGAINRGEKYRLFTSGFLHADPNHLIMNMIGLYFFADQVVNTIGSAGFIAVYFGSLFAGSLLSLYFNKDNYMYSALGASGAVTGVLYSAILLGPELKRYFIFLPQHIGSLDLGIKAYLLGVGYLLYTIYAMKHKNDNIGHDAHFGGAIGGYIITFILASGILLNHLVMTILLTIPIVILFVMKRMGKL